MEHLDDIPAMSDPHPVRDHKGPLAWMAKNAVASNVLMAALVIGGLVFMSRVKQEVFPEFNLDVVSIQIAYPGASPEEVERAVTKTVEENIRGIDGVKTVTSTSAEGVAAINVELELDVNADRALNDVKAAVDRISSFPQDVEQPVVSLAEFQNQVLALVLYGDADEKALRALADKVRDELLQVDGISKAELAAVRQPEISIEVPKEKLRSFGLTLPQVAAAVTAANIELPAGAIKTDKGEILLRTAQRRDWGTEFESIVVLSQKDGSEVRLSDIATIKDEFQDNDQVAKFNGKPAAMIRVYRVGNETPVGVSELVYKYIEEHQKDLPPGVEVSVWGDASEMYRQRMDLLMRNAYLGLALVLLCLGLFLEIRLAFWVTLGIPISFLGAFLFLPVADISINMISLFAFIVTLGIVVDDAIVVGEAIYKRRQDGLPLAKAAVVGLHDVATPVIFSVLTTVVAFSPLLFVPGTMGKFFRNIPIVVITVLLMSLIESLLVLPAHLSHKNPIATGMGRLIAKIFGERLGPFGAVHRAQQRFSARFERFVETVFTPQLAWVARNRYLAIGAGFALLVGTLGYVASGRMDFTFMTKIEGDQVFAQLQMPVGTPAEETAKHLERMLATLEETIEEGGGAEANSRGMFSQLGAANFGGIGRGPSGGGASGGGHIAEVAIYLKPPDERAMQTRDLVATWRKKLGEIPGADSLKFTYTTGASAEAPISIRLDHSDVPTLEAAGADLASRLASFTGVKDIDDGVALGKTQLDFTLKPEARSLGITETELARQVRAAFFGAEASRQQRGRDEVRVYVRLPKDERTSLYDLEELRIRTPQGGEIPLAMAADVRWGRAYTSIVREDGRRVITVEADVEEGVTNANKVMAEVRERVFPEIQKEYPGLGYGLGGQQKRQAESLGALGTGFMLALILMYALMAIPFRSYVQPLIIMSAIPFGLVGAIGGHLIMGYDLSILSAMGFVALSGVVVNDSLVLISAINEFRAQGMHLFDAVVAGAARRFRPILLTSLTTFFGLAPMIVETSVQARFLIPMALSLGFGVIFSTFVILMIVPCLYLVLEDVGRLLRGGSRRTLAELEAQRA
jgi:multidrug efflux pump subunit AcrB